MNKQEQSIAITPSGAADLNRRQGQDRRRHSLRTITYCGLQGRGRRRQARRAGHDYYLDWYEPKLVFTGLAVFLMSCTDALLTLSLLQRGAYEANYFMAQLLEVSTEVFVVTKVSVTAFGILFLLMHSHFHILRFTSGRRLLQLMLPVYGLLIVYELVLMGTIR